MNSLLRFLLISFFAFFAFALLPALQAQAIPHLDQLNRNYGRQNVEQNLLQVVGIGGQPDPAQWVIYSRDPVNAEEIIEYTVVNGKVERARRLRNKGNQTVISRARVKTTPRAAFQQAEKEAVKAKIGFFSADYSLSNNPTTGLPEWALTLKGQKGENLGVVRVSAVNGQVTGVGWRAASGAENAAPPTVGESASEIGDGVLDLGRGIGRGIGRGLSSMGDWLQGE